uniref:Glutaredoxin domain-containing protein n=1 Tax=Oryza brachyantha TaxID=4533 RepID=J3LES0_ORYBR
IQRGGGVSCAVAGEVLRGDGLLGLIFDALGGDTPAERIGRLVWESAVVIFARWECCMCHVMRRLLTAVGVQATVINLDEVEEAVVSAPAAAAVSALFIGGDPVDSL